MKFRRESNPKILKDEFFSRTDPSIFISIAPVLLDWLNETSRIFSGIETNNPAPVKCVL